MWATRPFRFGDWSGEVRDGLITDDRLEEAVQRLVDPGEAKETLHWGRNYLYTVELPWGATAGGALEVVVKQFPGADARARWKRRLQGSKALRSWRAARAVAQAGVLTPEPLFLVESASSDGPTLYATGKVADFVESRYYFRAIAQGVEATEFPAIDRAELMRAIGELFRRLHGAGVWHRDLSIGNLLLQSGEAGSPVTIQLIDLDRCRLRRRLSTGERLRDICRLPILDADDRAIFWRSYWDRPRSLSSPRGLAFRALQQGFLAKNRWKPRLRRPIRTLKSLLISRRAYAHIPGAPDDAAARDKAVWDHLSDQPHQHASRRERAAIRMADAPAHLAALGAVCAAAPRIWSRYRELEARAFTARRPWRGAGIAVRPLAGREEELLAALEALGVSNVLLRLHPWQARHDDEEALARALHSRGYDLAFALPQNRDLVNDPERWRAAITDLAERFRPMGASFQVGQAINRSKWGIWNYREYLLLAEIAREVFARFEGTRLLGPAVIDFEFQAAAAVLNMKTAARFDAVSALLYVDRRGAPEAPQMGFDTVAKFALLRAIAETSRNAGESCWVTEVNWPLWEGPHSPAGRTVSVDEEHQADYLVRYFLLALASGFVDRVYWWQLAARGYGLIDPSAGELRRRPSFRAMATMQSLLADSTFVEAQGLSGTARQLRFDVDGRDRLVAWTVVERERISLDGEVVGATGRDGSVLEIDPAGEIELTGSPVYLDVARAAPAIDSADAG
ncbi:MAG: lipopolysaccharide kinase InaA family protein [Thermoanaerobaculia bacterium]